MIRTVEFLTAKQLAEQLGCAATTIAATARRIRRGTILQCGGRRVWSFSPAEAAAIRENLRQPGNPTFATPENPIFRRWKSKQE